MSDLDISRIEGKIDNLTDKVSSISELHAGIKPRVSELEDKTKSNQISILKNTEDINKYYQLVREVRMAGIVIGFLITVCSPILSVFLAKWLDS